MHFFCLLWYAVFLFFSIHIHLWLLPCSFVYVIEWTVSTQFSFITRVQSNIRHYLACYDAYLTDVLMQDVETAF
jgi:hypothetical protein